jgi:hypothetical protein
MIRAALVAVVAAGAFASGCGDDECSENDSYCVDDHTVRYCSRDTHEWSEPQACLPLNPYCATLDEMSPFPPTIKAYCVAVPDKVAECASATDYYCAGNTRNFCLDGYTIFVETCANGCSDGECAP